MLHEQSHPASWNIESLLDKRHMIFPSLRRRAYQIAKRVFDLVGAILLLILFLPLMAAIAVAIKLDSPGPAIYVQRRGGLNGKLFKFYKFRSMTNGHDHTQEHRQFAEIYINGNGNGNSADPVADGRHAFYKPSSNGRAITRVGRFLRNSSLDELPQLINIIKGDMSFVGPRPSIDYEVAMYTPYHRRRLGVLPGLTGWAQINGRSSLSFDEIVALDLAYISERSLWKDLRILSATIPAVLIGVDAG